MRASLTALTEELRRLKSLGVREIFAPPETLERLRSALAKRKPAKPESAASLAVAHFDAAPERVTRVGATPEITTSAPGREVTPVRQTLEPVTTPVRQPKPQLIEAKFTLPAEGTKAERLAALREIVLADKTCRAQLRPGKQVVFGVGNPEAQIMFVGEAPGAEEERQGEPFVGPAGKLLTKMIQAMGLEREQVYIANIMNWRPQMPTQNAAGEQVGNRPPTPEEMAYCLPFLRAQLEIVAPQVIVALGATAARGLLGHDSFKALGELRGKWREFAACPLMVTYHPSYILRNQSNRSKRVIWEDFLKVMERAALPISEKQRGYFL
ncbi:uracil-DNA glycosylase [Cephaloticoccus capnophilus]|uniref:Type-4 uracil-DNA glycosylase n=1 Tax=Cephaloticoccus capnophilus TaxID=1548208 RepID=A0A139STQ2_9BACT|nr:uracil-DNA glycosylase [Cephaloticoccus capnophilus]KXU37969.1 uracil-DNA glycosylase [Cephaloticoccus capnophilus]